jgi:type II secretion system protein N
MAFTLKTWQRRAAYVAFAVVAFLYALHATFPAAAVAQRLAAEAAAAGWKLNAVDSEPAGLAGVRMTGVTLQRGSGARFGIESLTAKLRVLPLLLGRRGVDFDARLFDGTIEGAAEVSSARRRIDATIDRVDLARAPALREAIGVALGGTVRGDVDLTLDDQDPAKSTGKIDLAIENAVIQAGQLPIPGMASGLTVPRVSLGTIAAQAAVRDGRAAFQRFEAKGGDLEMTGQDFYFALQPRLAQAPLFGRARLTVKPAFWSQPAGAKLKPVAELALASGRAPDGSYGLQVYGTVGRPQVRLAPPGATAPAAAPAGAPEE